MDTIQIDGAMGEGGGQIIRTAVALAAITGKATELVRIRARRSKPGLQAQHLTAVRAAATLCRAELRGAELGSQYLRFVPTAEVVPGQYTFDLAKSVAERGVKQLQKDLSDYGVPVTPVLRDLPSSGAGASVLLVAECEKTTEGWQSLGERGKAMEQVATEAARKFKHWYRTECGTDEHLADQLALPAALTPGVSCWTTARVSEHLRTVLQVIPLFLSVETTVEENEDGTGTVRVNRTGNII
jgi:RNA 3'-terminal phosphate cyclase